MSRKQIKKYFTAKPKRSQSLQEYVIAVDMIVIINTILNKWSTYSGFVELFVKRFPKGFVRADIIADCYKTKPIKPVKYPYSITSFKGSK